MTWSQFLFSFDGRIGRAWYWFFALAMMVFFCGLGLISVMVAFSGPMGPEGGGGPGAGSAILGIVLMLLGLATLWPALAVQAKRWHDVDKSAWWILINLVPGVGGLISLIFCGFIAGTPGPNQYGDPPA
jgi:uncharacterized membrane protein YhaH (DUF805 family)